MALGLTAGLGDIESGDTWVDGIVLALILAFVARPLALLPLLLPARLTWGERIFIAWAGLKGAVPILLGALALSSGVEDAPALYGIVFIVVVFSVVVQGASVPVVADRLRIPFRRLDHDLGEVLEFVLRETPSRAPAGLPTSRSRSERGWASSSATAARSPSRAAWCSSRATAFTSTANRRMRPRSSGSSPDRPAEGPQSYV